MMCVYLVIDPVCYTDLCLGLFFIQQSISTVSQLILSKILWEIAKEIKIEEVKEEDLIRTTYTEDYDEDDEVQARIWNQFAQDVRT